MQNPNEKDHIFATQKNYQKVSIAHPKERETYETQIVTIGLAYDKANTTFSANERSSTTFPANERRSIHISSQ